MQHIYYASQDFPQEQYKKLFKTKKDKNTLYNYLEILKNNDINDPSIFYELEQKGCTYAYVANAIITKIITNSNQELTDNDIKNIFGFSLNMDENILDCNSLMIDIFAFLHDRVKLTIHKYKTYHFKNAIEAVKNLFGEELPSENDAILKLFNNGIIADGIDPDSKEKKYKNIISDNQVVYGTYSEIAESLLNIKDNDINKEKLQKILLNNDITFEEHDKSPESKLSGLNENNINLWINYYLLKKNINIEFKSEVIEKEINTYYNFQNQLTTLLNEGYILGTSSSPNSNAFIVSSEEKIPISSNQAGHKMLITGFDENNNIIVSSWGKDFIIPKEYYKNFTYTKAKIKTPEIIKYNKENNFKY